MRSAIITALSAISFALAGWALPLVFPRLDSLIAKGGVIVASTLLVVSLIRRLLDRSAYKKQTSPASQSHSGFVYNTVAFPKI